MLRSRPKSEISVRTTLKMRICVTRYFRLYDINTSELLFQSELYINFVENYRALKDKFYCFPLQKTIVAFEFANVHDAMYFKKLVDQFSFSGDPKQIAKDEKKCLGVSSRVSKPNYFTKKEHAGWNPITQTFNLKSMPAAIKNLLKKAGFKKKALTNRETALDIFKMLIQEVDFNTIQKEPA